MNAEIIKGIEATIAGLESIKSALEAENCGESKVAEPVMNAPVGDAPKKSRATRKAVAKKSNPVEKEQTQETATDETFTRAELEGMKYNEFKKLAARLGVDCKGTRDDIMNRVVALGVVTDAERDSADENETEEEEAPKTVVKKPAKSADNAGSKKLGAKKAVEDTTDEYDKAAEEVMAETDVEDVIAALADVDVKATKKNVKTQLAKALREGLIELGDDDEDEEDEDVEEETAEEEDAVEETSDDDEDEEIAADGYFEQFDPDGLNDPSAMADERKETVVEKMDEILTAVSEGELTEEDITEFLTTTCTQDELDLLGDEYTENDLLKMYMEIQKRFVDDDGDYHEPADPYVIGDDNMCCGHKLKYDKKTKQFMCEQCGATYEAE